MNHAFFLSSTSPGAVLRFLERLAHNDTTAPNKLLLSDAVGTARWRLLLPDENGWLLSLAPRMVAAFPPKVYWLDRTNGHFRMWLPDGCESLSQIPPIPRRLLVPAKSGADAWAKAQGLPIERLTKPPRIIDYQTVAQLDQKSLLLEDTPRLYRFVLAEVQ